MLFARRYLPAFVGLLCLLSLPAWADWAADRDASSGYVTVTVAATAVDEAVPFVYVALSDLPAGFHSALDAASDTDGHTIRVSTADGSAEIACYPVGYSAAGDTGALFFLGTGMSASVDVDYRIYCGNTALTMPSPGPVFADYEAFYLPGVTTTDLTGNGHDLTAVGSPGTAASGIEGILAATLDGSSQYFTRAAAVIAGPPFTFEALASSDSATARQNIISTNQDSNGSINIGTLRFAGDVASDPIQTALLGGGGSVSSAVSSTGYTTSTLHYAAGTRTGTTTGTTTTYIDGGSAGTNSTTINTYGTVDRFTIGAQYVTATTNNYFDGNISVAYVTASARSANYVSTMDTNWAAGLYTAGSWTPAATGDGETDWFELSTVSSSTGWTNPTQALTSLANAATYDIPAATTGTPINLVDLAGDLSEFTGEAITGIAVEVVATGEDTGTRELYDATIRLIIGGTVVGDNKAGATQWTDTSQLTRVYGGAGILWGVTPSDTDVAGATFGVSLAFSNDGPDDAALMSLYRVRMKIYYGDQNTTAFFAFFD